MTAKSQDDGCEICPDGFYCPPGTAQGGGLPCKAGYKCEAKVGATIGARSATEEICQAGTYSEAGASSCPACTPGSSYCPRGTPSSGSGETGIALPPAGVDINSLYPPHMKASKCRAGTYWVAGICTTCPFGHFCTHACVQPLQCPVS